MRGPSRGVTAILLVVIAFAALWWLKRDPLADLPGSMAMPTLAETSATAAAGRAVQHVILADATLGSIGFTLSLPEPLPARRLPVVVVLGGLGTGEHNIRFVHDVGENAVLGYDWPLPASFPKGANPLRLWALREQALAIPGEVAAMLRWVAAQPWSDGARISIVGFSLGAIAAPAIERVAAAEGVSVGWTVLAFGGAPLDALVEGDERIRPAWARPLLGLCCGRSIRHSICRI
jgi:hypothetical protein